MEGQATDENPDPNTVSAKQKSAEHVAGVAAAAEPRESSPGSDATTLGGSGTPAIDLSSLLGVVAPSESTVEDVRGTAPPVKTEYAENVDSAAGALPEAVGG